MKLDLRKKIQLCIVRVCFESKQGNDTQTCDKKAWNYHAFQKNTNRIGDQVKC